MTRCEQCKKDRGRYYLRGSFLFRHQTGTWVEAGQLLEQLLRHNAGQI